MKVSARIGVNNYTEEGYALGKALVVLKVKLLLRTVKSYQSCVSVRPDLIIYINLTKRMMTSTHHPLRESSSDWWIDIITILTNE